MKQYGDEDFIFLIKEEAVGEDGAPHENHIGDGYILLHDEKILFKEVPVLGDGFSMVLPEMFGPMDKGLAELKYPSVNRPDYILTNPATTINLTFSHKADKMEEGQAGDAKDAIQEVVLRLHPESKVLESKVVQAGGRDIAYFDFVTPAIDTDIYNLMFFFSLKGKMLMGSFNCLEGDMGDWKGIAIQMLGSVRFL